MVDKDGFLLDSIKEAKSRLGKSAAEIIVKELDIQKWDGKKGCCPFHNEDTPSLIWCDEDKSGGANYFKCFGCGITYDIVSHLMQHTGLSFKRATQDLCDAVGVDCNISVKSKDKSMDNYKFPKDESIETRSKAESYMKKRSISKQTLDYAGIKEDPQGNIIFEYRDTDEVLLNVKYRPSRAVRKGQAKMWFQKDADNCPSLFNMHKVDITKPLIITEGEIDCLAVIEAGLANVVSVPYGANDSKWIEFNFEWLDQFEKIVLWFDDDSAGQKAVSEVIPRLGRHRAYYVSPPKEVKEALEQAARDRKIADSKCDANNVLIACGKGTVKSLVANAEDMPSKRLKFLMDCEELDVRNMAKVTTGYEELDKKIYGNFMPCFNIITGYTGCVDKDTEYFNGKEWKKISEYEEGEHVLQYTMDRKAELVLPEAYYKYPCDHFWHLKTKYGIDQCISDEHDIVYITSKGNIQKKNCLEWDKDFDEHQLESLIPKIRNGGGLFTFHSFEQFSILQKILGDLTFKDKIIWEKSNPMPRNRDRRYISNIEIASWYIKKGEKWVFNRQANNYDGSVLRYPSESGGGFKRYHPCQKNLKMIEEIILRHTNEGELVLDPFMGGGTTAVACINTGRNYIGFELDTAYCDIANNRIQDIVSKR